MMLCGLSPRHRDMALRIRHDSRQSASRPHDACFSACRKTAFTEGHALNSPDSLDPKDGLPQIRVHHLRQMPGAGIAIVGRASS